MADVEKKEELAVTAIEYEEIQSELLELKAKTMYRMVEDIKLGNKAKKIVFLRNAQAQLLVDDSISKDGKGIELLMSVIELKHKPEMVINVIGSCGSAPLTPAAPSLRLHHGPWPWAASRTRVHTRR